MERIERGIAFDTFPVSKVRMVYAGNQWHVQYKKPQGWAWKPYCISSNYDLAKNSLDELYKSGTATIHRYAMKETMEILELTDEE